MFKLSFITVFFVCHFKKLLYHLQIHLKISIKIWFEDVFNIKMYENILRSLMHPRYYISDQHKMTTIQKSFLKILHIWSAWLLSKYCFGLFDIWHFFHISFYDGHFECQINKKWVHYKNYLKFINSFSVNFSTISSWEHVTFRWDDDDVVQNR